MKKSIIFSLVLAIALVGAIGAMTVRAETPQQQTLMAEIEARKIALQEHRASSTEMIAYDQAMTRIGSTAKYAEVHLNLEMQRLADIQSKIESRLAKLDQDGADTASARADLDLVAPLVTDAQFKTYQVGILEAATSSPFEAVFALRTAVKDAQESIDAVQRGLVKVVVDMKSLEQ
ncbi:MAG: hypothetical protein KGH68_02900 [Patescibacteria group bacterium]|nr:hypothetical protein [Patescibacteria group bacterium]